MRIGAYNPYLCNNWLTMDNKRIIIAIDGHSSCGKSTFAKAIAARLGYIFKPFPNHYAGGGAAAESDSQTPECTA